MYEIMRYWDEDLADWDAEDRDFAVAWRSQPKWVVSRSLKSVGPNATLVADDFEKVIRRLKAELDGEIQVGGPVLAQSLTEAGLIDEYRLYLRPVVLGGGKPFFAGPRPPLHLVAREAIRGVRPVNELAARFGVRPVQIGHWKKQALAGIPGIFTDRRGNQSRGEESLTEEVYEQIGRLKMDLEWLKKQSGLAD